MSEGEARLPPRPTIPPTLWVFAVTWASQRLILLLAFRTGTDQLFFVMGVVCLVWSILAMRMLWQRIRRQDLQVPVWAVVLMVAAAGTVSATLEGIRQVRSVDALQSCSMSSLEFIVESDPSPTVTGYRYRAHVCVDERTAGDVWLSTVERLSLGSTIACVGRYKVLGDDDYGRSSWGQGICGSVMVVRVLRTKPPRGLIAAMRRIRDYVLYVVDAHSSGERALLAGCVCGYREALVERGIDEDFSTCGLAHIISVSGAHLAVAAALMAEFLGHTRWSVRQRLVTLAVFAGLYVVFCGTPVSALRAWLMMLAAFGSQVAGRRAHALSGVSIVATLIVLMSPQTGGQMGFELSVLSVAGLCLLSPYAQYLLRVVIPNPRLPRGTSHRLRQGVYTLLDATRGTLAATLVCQVVTLPVTAPTFGKVSLVAPLANMLVAPLVTPLIACGLIACLLVPLPHACSVALALCDVLSHVLLSMVSRLSVMPHAYLPVGGGCVWSACLALVPLACLIVWPRLRRVHVLRAVGCAAFILGLVLLRWRYFVPARIVVLDVGQGDAILVQDGASAVLVDAGPDDAVVEALARWHVMHLDAIVVTHLHDDHYGGIGHLQGFIACEKVMVAKGVREAMDEGILESCRGLTQCDPIELSYGDAICVGGYRLRMIWPHGRVDGSENAHSIELAVTYDERDRRLTALLTGDAECDETGACIEGGDIGDIDLLKVGHHGSEVSLTSEEARVLDPEVSVASAGEGNRYGHPTEECVRVIEGVGSTFFCTKDVGDVEVRPGREGSIVRTQRHVNEQAVS